MEVFVARQPIMDKRQKVYGYELLFRQSLDNYFQPTNGDQATAGVIDTSFSLIGIENLTEGKRAFINFTENLLREDFATLLPKEAVVIEVLEQVRPEPDIIAACLRLKQLGYLLALDDFVFSPGYNPLIQLADIIKVDFLQLKTVEQRAAVLKYGNEHIKFLAEKVETREDYEVARKLGYTYFQGYFFSKPIIFQTHDIPTSKWNNFLILKEVNQVEPDFNRIESLIQRDVSFTYRLLKFINSAAFGLNIRIKSLKHALVMIGISELRKWVSLYALRGLGKDKPNYLMVQSVMRAKFCELIAERIGLSEKSSDLFLLGMLSMIDAFIDRPMNEIIAELPLDDKLKSALLRSGQTFYDYILELVIIYEKGEWEQLNKFTRLIKLDEASLPKIYQESLRYVQENLGMVLAS